MTYFDTPAEAALRAENARLRAENEYLKRAIEDSTRKVTPYGIEENVITMDITPSITLPRVSGIDAKLKDGHLWKVLAWYDSINRGRVELAYYMDRLADRFDDRLFINDILPRMHQQFIKTLAEYYSRTLR